MKCKNCRDKGYIESSILRDASNYPMITKCPNPSCPFESKYYKKIREDYSNEPEKIDQQKNKSPKNDYTLEIDIPEHLLDKPKEVLKLIGEKLNIEGEDNPRGSLVDIKNEYDDSIIDKLKASFSELKSKYSSDRDIIDQEPIESDTSNYSQDLSNYPQDSGNYSQDSLDQSNYSQDSGNHSQDSQDQKPWTNQVPVEQSRSEAFMEATKYIRSLPKDLVEHYINHVKTKGEFLPLFVSTPFGPYHTDDLFDADRVTYICRDYMKHGDELDYADSFDNVIVFPLGEALGF